MDESDVCYGDKVELNDDQTGIIKYIGTISAGDPSHGKNKNGIYYGVHLSTKTGSHNGTVKGRKYFQCPHKYGIFVRLKDISEIIKKSKDKSSRYHMNQRIYIKDKQCLGTIRYIGLCQYLDNDQNNNFKTDKLWFGIELNSHQSRNNNKYNNNDGVIQNITYFKSNKHCNALFIQKSNIEPPPQKTKKSPPPPKAPPPPTPSNSSKKVNKYNIHSLTNYLKNVFIQK